jgi:pilus assembly protein CpaD
MAIATGLSLTACGNMATNRTLNSVNQPVVERTNYALDLNAYSGSLPMSEQQRLSQWFEAMDLGYGDRVAIDDPMNSGSAGTLDMVEAIASRHGVKVDEIAPITVGNIVPGTVRVVVTRSKAKVPGCPDWSSSSEINYNNATSSNYGCATNSNLAAMIANPEDLVRGQTGSDTSIAIGSDKAIKTYREATPTGAGGLKESSTQAGGGQ